MNAGYMMLWILMITMVLMATGWKEQIVPDVSWRKVVLFGAAMALSFISSQWFSPFKGIIQLDIHVSIFLMLTFAALSLYEGKSRGSYIGYLLLCILMVSVIWGIVRRMYSYDPVFYWIDPSWDAPLLAGLFCGAFVSQAKQQFAMIAWGAVLGETIYAAMLHWSSTTYIGQLNWWDSFWLALAAARVFSLLLKGIRLGGLKLNDMLGQIRGGRSS
ncbi:YphA family membrane protein [Paenibacillus sinopodophylli]|uniref:YphA family membrane protein n=1 Tax=Paenibacillus sinopodophylli TaxID=1837342 RepID=UPI00110D20C6|nr:hypothetical protein [Paenibacillus sinopodophylli]